MIQVENLSRNYGEFKALDKVSFKINKGEIVGLLGHNGAGKTTTLKMITGVLDPSDGSIQIDHLSYPAHRLQIQAKIGYLPENSPTYPEMTVIEYLDYVARIRGIRENKIKTSIEKAIKRTKLADKAFSKISTLSKGFKQRVGVAQAIIHHPEILILDEPTNGLDPSQILEMRSLIKELSVDSTVIISTHILQEVEAICDRVIIIMQGKLVKDEKLVELTSQKDILLISSINQQSLDQLIKDFPEIKNYQFISNHHHQYEYLIKLNHTDQNLIPKLAEKLVHDQQKIYQLGFKSKNLESIFREVNQGLGGNA